MRSACFVVRPSRPTAGTRHRLVIKMSDRCYCAGCIGMGPCDDGIPCGYGCGRRAANQWGTCKSCEDEAQGLDLDDEGDTQ